jgi:ubiquinone/menaquinone biosynthesis C-methylase UbiE
MGWFEKMLRINDMVCPWWLCYSFDNPLRRLIHDPERILNPHVKTGMTAVDIGCGMGYFTLGLAKLVGSGGKVIAVDLQEQMLAALGKRARKADLADRIVPHRCRPDLLGVEGPADFVLAFWMAHEVRDKPRFFTQISAFLKPGGRFPTAERTSGCAEPRRPDGEGLTGIQPDFLTGGKLPVMMPYIPSRIVSARNGDVPIGGMYLDGEERGPWNRRLRKRDRT